MKEAPSRSELVETMSARANQQHSGEDGHFDRALRCKGCPPPTPWPTPWPTQYPTPHPTHMPTANPCADGSHGCNLESTTCMYTPGGEATCRCKEGRAPLVTAVVP